MAQFDASVRVTNSEQEPVRAGVVDQSGAVAGQGFAVAAQLTNAATATRVSAMETKSGVLDSFADAATDLVNDGLKIQEGYIRGQVNKDINSAINDFALLQQNPDLVDALKSSDANVSEALSRVESTSENPESFRKQAQAYKRAVDQGLMTPSDLKLRLMAITRQHVNANPGAADAIIQESNRILELSGVSSLRDPKPVEDEQAKARAEGLKQLNSAVAKHNIPNVDRFRLQTDPDYQIEVQEELNKRLYEQSLVEEVVTGDKVEQITSSQQARQWASNKGNSTYNGYIAGVSQDFISVVESGLPAEEQINRLEQDIVPLQRDQLIGFLEEKGMFRFPEGERILKRFDSHVESLMKGIRDSKTQATRLSIVKNQEEYERNIGQLEVNKVVNPAAITTLKSMPDALVQKMVLRNASVSQRLMTAIAGLLDDSLASGHQTKGLINSEELTPGKSDAATASIDILLGGKNADFKTILGNIDNAQKNGRLSQQDHFKYMDSLNDYLANPSARANIQGAGDDLVLEMVDNVNNYIVNLGTRLNKTIEESGVGFDKVSVSSLPGGGVRYEVPSNRQLQLKLNTDYASRYNKSINSISVLSGQGTNAVANIINSMHGGAFGIQGDSKQEPQKKSNQSSSSVVDKIIQAESAGNPKAKNADTSAFGLGQFTKKTWVDSVKKFAPEEAEGLTSGEILNKINDQDFHVKILGGLTKDNQNILQNKGIEANDRNTYLAHFAGVGTASKIIKADPNTPIEDIASADAIRSNEKVLKGKTAGQVLAWAENKMR